MPTFVGAIGVAGLTAVARRPLGPRSAPEAPASLATLGGLHAAFLVAGAVALLGALVAPLVLRPPRRPARDGLSGSSLSGSAVSGSGGPRIGRPQGRAGPRIGRPQRRAVSGAGG
ncbi:hypothetical protein [Nonomuraea dietziae]|uniref:hypothetical protein n=1 Tax=Nonomuraea dietziae TaxID=65515 RepID=UPI0031D87637